jgi:hypothetical protein
MTYSRRFRSHRPRTTHTVPRCRVGSESCWNEPNSQFHEWHKHLPQLGQHLPIGDAASKILPWSSERIRKPARILLMTVAMLGAVPHRNLSAARVPRRVSDIVPVCKSSTELDGSMEPLSVDINARFRRRPPSLRR